MNLTDVFTTKAIAAYWEDVAPAYTDYMGKVLFPPQKKAGLDLSWLRGSKGAPVSLMPTAFDAKTTFRDRIGFEKLETEMPFFREGFRIKEKDRQELLRVKDSNDPYANAIIARVFDDAAELLAGAEVVPERMIFQLLFPENGNVGISIKANGVDYTYNYDPDGSWKTSNYTALTGSDLWTATSTADPFAAFQAVKDSVAGRTGVPLTTAIMSTNTFNMMGKTDAVKNRWLTTTGRSMGYLTRAEIIETIRGTAELETIVYDKAFQDEDRVAHKFVPDGYVALIPDGTLGNTWRGTTPEEADLTSGANVEVTTLANGIAIKRIVETDPVNVNTIASEIVLPSYERMDTVAVLKVIA